MPLYEYQCTQCGERREILQKFSDPPLSHCLKCGGDMKKLQSSPAIQFKGSGFYKTDYASSSSKGQGSSGSESGSKGEPSSGSEASAKGESSRGESSSRSASSSAPSETRSDRKSSD